MGECSLGCSTWLGSSGLERPGANSSGWWQECRVACKLSTLKMSRQGREQRRRKRACCFVGGRLQNARSARLLSRVCLVASGIHRLLEPGRTHGSVASRSRSPLESPGSASHATEICCCIKRNLESNAELPRGLSGKESASNAGATDDADSIPR